MAMKRFADVDAYIEHHEQWADGLDALRAAIRATDLEETVKWGAPCYTHAGKNVVGMAAFKDYFGLWFHQGVFLEDDLGVLINAQAGKTKALRQWRFTRAADVKPRHVKRYVKEALALAREGREIKPARHSQLDVPPELAAALDKRKKTKTAFEALSPGRQREYSQYVSEAKREATKASRVEKIVPMIEAGVGLNDKYRNC